MSAQTQQRLLWSAGVLTLILWFLLPSGHNSSQFWSVSLVLGLGGVVLWLKTLPSFQSTAPLTKNKTVSRETVQHILTSTKNLIGHLEDLAPVATVPQPLQKQLSQITADLDRRETRLLIMGGTSVGKSAVQDVLQTQWLPQLAWPCQLTEASSQLLQESDPAILDQKLDASALAVKTTVSDPVASADLVLFLIQGDLTDSEYQCLQRLKAQQKRVLLILNKQDHYLPTQQVVLQRHLQQRLQPWLTASDILTISAHPQVIKVRRHQDDGTWEEFLEQPQPQVDDLLQRLTQLISQESESLILQQTYQCALALQAEVQGHLNQTRRKLAQPIIERYQWLTGATAFANPFPTLDLLAAAAISGKMVMELGHLYRLKFSLAQGQAIASTLAGAMLKLGLVEISTQALGSLLKGHAFSFVAGGLLQGVSAAHLTRIAGMSLVEHFQGLSEAAIDAPESNWDPEKLKQTLSQVFQQHQKLDHIKVFMQQAIGRFRSQGALLESTTAGS